MELKDLGFNRNFEKIRIENKIQDFQLGRVIAEHKELYIIRTIQGEFEAEITGNLRFTAIGREDFPAVGDWVVLTIPDRDFAIIHQILPRFSIIKRQSVGQPGDVQIIATNIDYAFIVQAVDRDFNINRLERYLTISFSSHVTPIILLTKMDLINEQQAFEIQESIKMRVSNVPIIAISNETKNGYDELKEIIQAGKTYCMLGSSGVGKSTLINNLSGKNKMRTDTISQSTNKGRHVTTHRELIVLESGGILIDNPGMKEVGIADSTNGLETTFHKITDLAKKCKFKDCSHTNETGCSVLEALENGELDKKYYENYLKIQKEKIHYETTVSERRKQDKIFGKIQKDFNKKNLKRGKF